MPYFVGGVCVHWLDDAQCHCGGRAVGASGRALGDRVDPRPAEAARVDPHEEAVTELEGVLEIEADADALVQALKDPAKAGGRKK